MNTEKHGLKKRTEKANFCKTRLATKDTKEHEEMKIKK
jgi:hypothetical protein